jgi:hypothetical protein
MRNNISECDISNLTGSELAAVVPSAGGKGIYSGSQWYVGACVSNMQ